MDAMPDVIVVGVCIAALASFALLGMLLRDWRKKPSWTAMVVADTGDDGCFEYISRHANELDAWLAGSDFHDAYIKRPDGSFYRLRDKIGVHVTQDRIAEAMLAQQPLYENILKQMGEHIQGCRSCREKYFHSVRTIRWMRSPNAPLLDLARRTSS